MIEIFKVRLSANGEILVRAKVIPSSGRSEIIGLADDETLKVALKSAPEKGRANEELVRLLAKRFDIDKRGIKIISGASSRLKLVRISG